MRPASIVNFERIVLLIVVLGLVSTAMGWNEFSTYVAQQGYGAGLLIAVHAIGFGLMLLLMWLIARRRSVVAKWIWILLSLVGLGLMVPAIGTVLRGPLPDVLLQLAQLVLTLLSVWMLLRPDAAAWFRGGPAAR